MIHIFGSTPRYSWNTAKVDVKHQSTNQLYLDHFVSALRRIHVIHIRTEKGRTVLKQHFHVWHWNYWSWWKWWCKHGKHPELFIALVVYAQMLLENRTSLLMVLEFLIEKCFNNSWNIEIKKIEDIVIVMPSLLPVIWQMVDWCKPIKVVFCYKYKKKSNDNMKCCTTKQIHKL